MDPLLRIETILERALAHAGGAGCPPRLAEAMRHAVLPGGARLRPSLCITVADACGGDDPALADAAAAAVELLHCASLVHDDLPAFDDATERRGRPTVHRLFGEAGAVLAGDALIVLAFEVLAKAPARHPERIPGLVGILAAGVAPPRGIVAGQAWEQEPSVDLMAYHRAKTGALFEAAALAGALAAGAEPEPWRALGTRIGELYQLADDLYDVRPEAGLGGRRDKGGGNDARLGRPNAAQALGPVQAEARLLRLMQEAGRCVPRAAHPERAERWVQRLVAGLWAGGAAPAETAVSAGGPEPEPARAPA